MNRPFRLVGSTAGLIGGVLLLAIALIALLGPLVAPHGSTDLVCVPYSSPSAGFPAGCDAFGRDVLSRVLDGGRTVVIIGGFATMLAYVIGCSLGLIAGYRGGVVDSVLLRGVDLLLAFPPVLFLLILATGAGAGIGPLLVGIVIVQVPGIVRIVRASTMSACKRGFVEAAVARGERPAWVLGREVLPTIAPVLVADAGTRLTSSILLVAAMNFLGLGLAPPAADWSLMISENRAALTSQPWSVLLPATMIAILSISANMFFDGLTRRRASAVETA